MRILQVSTYDISGGAESVALTLASAYRECGHESWLAVGFKKADDQNVFEIPSASGPWHKLCKDMSRKVSALSGDTAISAKAARALEISADPLHYIGGKLGHDNFDHPGTWELLSLTPERPDIVHCHNLHGNYFDLRALPWLSKQVPVVLHLHDSWLLTGHPPVSFECDQWMTGCGKCKILERHADFKIDGAAYNWQRKKKIFAQSQLYVVAPSQWLIE